MKKILAINGSIRSQSSNGYLLNTIENMLNHADFSIFESLNLLPHFNPDLELPEIIEKFRLQVKVADLLLIVTPEYAHGIPGVLKNALDWLVSDENLSGKQVVIFVCSTGSGTHSLNSLIEILKTMSCNILPERCIQVSAIRSKFEEGKLVDEALKTTLTKFVDSIID